MKTVDHVLKAVESPDLPVLAAPAYQPNGSSNRIALAVPSMARHMSDEGWQLMQGLQHNGYTLYGNKLTAHDVVGTHVAAIVDHAAPGTLVLQDKREWDASTHNHLALANEHFHNVKHLAERPDIFKLTVLKDSHQRPGYHRDSAEEIGCHAWITYYHPRIVKHLAPYVRAEHLIRTWHTVNPDLVPSYSPANRQGCFLSGAISGVYPLRWALYQARSALDSCTYLGHPGYHNFGTNTPAYLSTLAKFKVAICTSSIYGYALRKIIEATACGCVVITDLPVDDQIPWIDGNLVRVNCDQVHGAVQEIRALLPQLYQTYNPEQQFHYAELARTHFSFQSVGTELAANIEKMRVSYNSTTPLVA